MKALSAFEIAESRFKPSHPGYHAKAEHRRRETREGGEYFELCDRAHTGKLRGGAHR